MFFHQNFVQKFNFSSLEIPKISHKVKHPGSDSLIFAVIGFISSCTINSPPARFLRTNWFKMMLVSITVCCVWGVYGNWCEYAIHKEANIINDGLEPGTCPIVDNQNTIEIGQAIREYFEIEFPKNPDYAGINYYPWV